MKALLAVYDLEWAPVTFDVMFFLAMAQLASERGEFDGFSVVFLHGERGWRRITAKDQLLPDEEKQWRLNNIHLPLAGLARRCLGRSEGRSDLLAGVIDTLKDDEVFPHGYRTNRPAVRFLANMLFKEKPTSDEMRVFAASTSALGKVNRWLEIRNIRKPVTITVRASPIEPGRNSVLSDWIAAAERIRERGYDPIVIPDTHLATMGVDNLKGIPAYGLGALSIDLRLAMYDRALLNISHGGGPGFLPWFTDGRMLAFLPVDNLPIAAKGSKAGMAELLGVEVDGDWPNRSALRRFVWRPAMVDDIIDEFDAAVVHLAD